MVYYQGGTVSFQEIPTETSLIFAVADCPHTCPGCHSPHLRKAKGADLLKDLPGWLSEYGDAVSCVCLMGEGRDLLGIANCFRLAKKAGKKTALYTGLDLYECHGFWVTQLDYLKTGPYVKELGGLDSPRTNQRLYVGHCNLKDPELHWVPEKDLTYMFRRKQGDSI